MLVWIRRYQRASDGSYGYRKIQRDLVAGGVRASQALVRRVMRDHDLYGVAPRRYKTTTVQDPQARPAPDLLERNFSSTEPGARLVGDITYLRTWAGWAYLSVVICLATKRVVGWHVSTRADAQLVIDSLEMASRNDELAPDPIFHSDRGCPAIRGLSDGLRRRAVGVWRRPSRGRRRRSPRRGPRESTSRRSCG